MNPNKSNINSPFDNLFEQAANISKAHAYDILVEQVKELKAENNQFKTELEAVRGDNDYLIKNINKMTEENERLLSSNKELIEALSELYNTHCEESNCFRSEQKRALQKAKALIEQTKL